MPQKNAQKKTDKHSDKATRKTAKKAAGKPTVPANPDTTLGGRLHAAREARGLSVTDVSRLLGVLPRTVTNWETDRSEPRFNQLHHLAVVLHAPPIWLIGGGDSDMTESPRPVENAETASLMLKLDQMTDMHAKMATVLFEAQAELRQLQNRIDELGAQG